MAGIHVARGSVRRRVKSYGFQDGTNGSAYTIDTPAQGASGFSALVGNDQAAHGSLSLRTNGDNSYQYVQKNLAAAVASVAARYYVRFGSSNTSSQAEDLKLYPNITDFASTGPKLFRVNNGKLRLTDAAATPATVWTSAVAPSIGTWYRVEVLQIASGAGTAQFRVAYYLLDSLTAIEDVTSAATFTSVALQSAHLGKMASGAFTPAASITWFGDFAFDSTPGGALIGPYIA